MPVSRRPQCDYRALILYLALGALALFLILALTSREKLHRSLVHEEVVGAAQRTLHAGGLAATVTKQPHSKPTASPTLTPPSAPQQRPSIHTRQHATLPAGQGPGPKYHVVVSSDSNVYQQWQMRVCYYWYKKMKTQHPDSAMGGFTRLLHTGRPDALMNEMPTVVVKLMLGSKGRPVAKKYAFLQWLWHHAAHLEEEYIFMSEPDHIILKPIPNLATPQRAMAAAFDYIQPSAQQRVLKPYFPAGHPVRYEDIAPIGSSPVIIHRDNLSDIVEPWLNVGMRMTQDPEVLKEMGWVADMYAYSVASYLKPGGPMPYILVPELLCEPPFDYSLRHNGLDKYILHYNYRSEFDDDGKPTEYRQGSWGFEKRDFFTKYPPKGALPLPPEKADAPAVRALIRAINEASAAHDAWYYDE